MTQTLPHSIIIPHRNREPYLRACLRSLAMSADACELADDDFEVIIVHAGEAMELPPGTPWQPWSYPRRPLVRSVER